MLTIGRAGGRFDDVRLSPKVVIFDIEGTLVDAVLPTLRCWAETLGRFGFAFNTADLHPFSGLDAGEMLERIIPHKELRGLKDRLLAEQGRRYREEFIDAVQPIPGTHELILEVKQRGIRIAATSNCQRGELVHYCKLMKAEKLFDALACGTHVSKQRPHSELIDLALKRLRIRDRAGAVMVGDTPFDALAARRAGVLPVGVLTGYFSAPELRNAGCAKVFRKAHELLNTLQESGTAVPSRRFRHAAAHAM